MDDALQKDLSLIGPETQVGHLVRKRPLVCLASDSIRAALEAMDKISVGSIVVVNADGEPIGILTRYDLIRRIILPARDLHAPIESVMTPNPIRIEANESVMEAMVLMATHRIRHLPVMRDDTLIGVLSESDVMAHQRQSLRSLSSLIAKAVKFEELASVGLDIRRLAQRLIGEGLSATAVAKLMSHLNDAMTVRVIELVKADSKIMSPPRCHGPGWRSGQRDEMSRPSPPTKTTPSSSRGTRSYNPCFKILPSMSTKRLIGWASRSARVG